MKLIDCPLIGTRPASEFVYGGSWRAMPEPESCSDAEWARYVFHRDGAPGIKRELWCHLPSGTWLVAERDTLTDSFLRTMTIAAALAEEGAHG